ncbi:unnamed protein product [Caenorhabditis angaria]|uniref:Uncharacterized protein n=1 Tax=Caenorhabditis angaria TaxID=860376 RepID=A0A9P1IJ72_9PELO|nr:unnamed protein product [Caenorhabditis angaria]
MVYQVQLVLLYKILIIILAICHVIIGIVAATQGFREEQLIRQLQLPKYFDDSQYIEENTILQSSYFPFILAISHIFFLALPIFIMPFFNILLSIISCISFSNTISEIVRIENNFAEWFDKKHNGDHTFESLFLMDLFKELKSIFDVNFGVMIGGMIALILTILVNFWLIYWYRPRIHKSLSKENAYVISEE